MPYITQDARDQISNGKPAENAGELNYSLTKLALDYLDLNGLNYQTINDIIGALEGAKLEFNRRVTAPYENGKIESNGDIFPEL